MSQTISKSPRSVVSPKSAQELPALRLDQERTELALAHLGLADALAHRYWNPRSDWFDLQQIARVGLLKAAIRYRADRASNFVAFAVPTICGEIKRHLRDHGWMIRPPRRVQDLRQQVRLASAELTQQLGHEPTRKELAAALAVETGAVDEALLSEGSVQPQSLDATLETGYALCEFLAADDEAFTRIDDMVSLNCALRGLTHWERRLLSMRFVDELKQQEIADQLNISQMQVSRTLTALLSKLRRQLCED